MAFCEKCGKELAPGEVCSCQNDQQNGMPQMESPAQAENANQQTANTPMPENQPTPVQDASEQTKKTGMIVLGVGAAVLVIALIAVVALLFGGGSYKKPVNDLVKLINSQNTDPFAYQALVKNPLELQYNKNVYNILKKNEDYKEAYDDTKEDIKDFYDDLKGFKITKVDFVSADEMKSKDLRNIEKMFDEDDIDDALDDLKDLDKGDYEDAAEDLEISVSDVKKFVKVTEDYLKSCKKIKIKKGYEVTLRFYGKYEGDSDKTEKLKDIKIIQMNGKWYIYDSYELFRGMTFTDDLSDVNLYELYRDFNSVSFGSMF